MNTWTDQEMREHLEELGYDLTDDEGNYDEGVMVEIASMVEKYKYDEETETWR